MNQINPLIRDIDNKSIVWFPTSNQYVVMEAYDAYILSELYDGSNRNNLLNYVIKDFKVKQTEAESYLSSIESLKLSQDSFVKPTLKTEDAQLNSLNGFSKFYKVSDRIFEVVFESEMLLEFIHPKFSHLETDAESLANHQINIFTRNEMFAISADGEFFGQWDQDHLHYLSGKFSMVLLSKIHNKPEHDWLAVLHASAITDGENCILFAGDSGSGKSTTAAVLMASGFNLVADDFVPLDKAAEINFFPAALSIKKKAIGMLSSAFPELENAKEYHNVHQQKIFRYISSIGDLPKNNYNAKALIFIKYREDNELVLDQISKAEALTKLIPDTWISDQWDNVERFLEWISTMPCYQLTYSDNDEMIACIKSLFKDE